MKGRGKLYEGLNLSPATIAVLGEKCRSVRRSWTAHNEGITHEREDIAIPHGD